MRVSIDFNIDESKESTYMLVHRMQPIFGFLEASDPQRVELDLSECSYFGPIGVALLSLVVRGLRARQHQVDVIPPRHKKLRAYAEFSGFAALCWDGPTEDPNNPKNETSPLTFTRGKVHAEVETVAKLVARHSSMNADMRDALQTLLAELLRNIQDHAMTEGVITARWFSKQQHVRVAIADLGPGLRTTLSRRFAVPSDQDAIQLALRDRTSSRSQGHNLGEGLPQVQSLLRKNHGELLIASGGVIYAWSASTRRTTSTFMPLGNNTKLPGTLCALKFRIDHQLYDDDDDTETFQF